MKYEEKNAESHDKLQISNPFVSNVGFYFMTYSTRGILFSALDSSFNFMQIVIKSPKVIEYKFNFGNEIKSCSVSFFRTDLGKWVNLTINLQTVLIFFFQLSMKEG